MGIGSSSPEDDPQYQFLTERLKVVINEQEYELNRQQLHVMAMIFTRLGIQTEVMIGPDRVPIRGDMERIVKQCETQKILSIHKGFLPCCQPFDEIFHRKGKYILLYHTTSIYECDVIYYQMTTPFELDFLNGLMGDYSIEAVGKLYLISKFEGKYWIHRKYIQDTYNL